MHGCSLLWTQTLARFYSSYTRALSPGLQHSLPTKVRLVKAMVFPVVMCGCDGWMVNRLSAEELMLLNCGVGEDS